jgi:photosystem II stability/assembly factor-like uncharacterized protein
LLKRIHRPLKCGLLALSTLLLPAALHAAQRAWEYPAPPVTRAQQAALLNVTQAGTRLVAVGERGLVLLSDDDGRQWRQSPTPVSVTLTRAYFVSERTGWAIGHSGVILRTRDGGSTWVKQFDGLQAARLAAARYSESSADPLARALAPIAAQLESDGADKPFFDILFSDERNGLVIGAYGLVFRTEDGGETWTPWLDHLDNPQGLHLYGIARSGKSLFIAGERGLLLQSVDGGRQFKSLSTPYKGSYFGIVSLSGGDLYLYGLRGHLFRSIDEGTSWTRVASPSDTSFSAGLALSDGEAAFANQAGQLFVGRRSADTLEAVPDIAPGPFTSIARSPSGTWILASLRGLSRSDAGKPGGVPTSNRTTR